MIFLHLRAKDLLHKEKTLKATNMNITLHRVTRLMMHKLNVSWILLVRKGLGRNAQAAAREAGLCADDLPSGVVDYELVTKTLRVMMIAVQ